MNPMDSLAQQVNGITDAAVAASTLLSKLSTLLIAAKNDPVKVQALADQLAAAKDNLSEAILANTPAEQPE